MHALSLSIRRWLLGGTDPRAVALAVWLGVAAGMVSGWNLTFAALVMFAVMLNVHTRVFAVCTGGATLLSWGLISWTLPVGQFVLDQCGLGTLLGLFGDDLFIVLLDWDRYTLTGGAALGIAGGAVLAFWARRLTVALHENQIDFDDDFCPRPEAGRGQRLFARLVLGRTALGTCDPSQGPVRFFRAGGIVTAGALTLSTFLLASWISPKILAVKLVDRLSQINQAEVSASDVRISLGSGRVEMDNLQVADPNDLGRDRLRAARVRGRLQMGALWRGRIDIDSVRLEVVRGGVARSRRARSDTTVVPALAKPVTVPTSVETVGTPDSTTLELADWLANWETYQVQLGHLQNLIRQIESFAASRDLTRATDRPVTLAADLIRRRAMRSPLANPRPMVFFKHLRVEGLSSEWGLGRKALLELTNLSNQMTLADEAATLEIVIPSTATEISATLNLGQPNGKHKVEFTSYERKLDKLLGPRHGTESFIAHAGTVMIGGIGWVDNRRISLDLKVETDGLKVFLAGNQPIAGLNPGLWNDALAKIDRLRFHARLAGPWNALQLEIQPHLIADELKRQLVVHGEYQLVTAMESQLAIANGVQEIAVAEQQDADAIESSESDLSTNASRAIADDETAEPYDEPGAHETPIVSQRKDASIIATERSPARAPRALSLLPGPIDLGIGYDQNFDRRVVASITQKQSNSNTVTAATKVKKRVASMANSVTAKKWRQRVGKRLRNATRRDKATDIPTDPFLKNKRPESAVATGPAGPHRPDKAIQPTERRAAQAGVVSAGLNRASMAGPSAARGADAANVSLLSGSLSRGRDPRFAAGHDDVALQRLPQVTRPVEVPKTASLPTRPAPAPSTGATSAKRQTLWYERLWR